ncbi:phenylpropionate dioxygenase-like ring-hydroxylating dioxygenase large terminal subunit [Microbacterium endophyticum]|uniref:Phenylpropionate dioxygenase-like ring-hydroxylating dioxygenase large terminal subunit n=1 Tax=Microbacterium endophyticum TaxID=1526412 RepID=A0A7W4V397_9MICO|nr:aromatic ring-hydroxylating dioxygenase subunit alpha [Microbacterium endophyticum]MBB2975348.1 phenylpropionate dioxygenase-like ring-hydroxylating dioxygenase large terminal subunit [Microbacterium endophyticum]NIK35633.1 phenylpropionate dioxygenase-like ring-hydroxylating dioxygenase large terminal subunit [Microbacterium endophyticum]
MLKQEDNEKITRSGPGTPLGNLLRSYWQPAALVSEMPGDRPVKALRIMSEDLVLFKKRQGWGLISRFCAHRGVDLSYGRLEEGGIRCLYHGWLYNGEGKCIEQPAEPDHSQFLGKIRIANYPCVEKNGIIFTYMGAGDPPPFPDYDCFVAPEEYTFAFKGLWECNWLQGLEGGIDPSHVSFLHKFIQEDPREMYGQQFAEEVEGTGKKLSMLVGESNRPDIEVETADHGLRVFALRQLTEDIKHVRVTNLMFPNAFVVPFGNTKVFTQWHVPIDDDHHYWFMIWYDFADKTDKDTLLQQRLEGVTLPDYRPVRNRSNNWGFDPQEQKDLTYTGMGLDINVHDQWAVESMGPIQDRTVERLGVSDRAVTANRRMLLRAIDSFAAGGQTPSHPVSAEEAAALTGPLAMDTISANEAWQTRWVERENERRAQSPWAAPKEHAEVTVDA